MEQAFGVAIEQLLTWDVLVAVLLAAMYGLFVGSIPGLTATMAVALVVPVTFFLGDTVAIAVIVTLEACSIFAGDIPTALVRIPGTPSSAAYTNDAYALTQRGQHQRTLGVSLCFSVTGGLFGAVVLIFAAPQLARVAFAFTSYEYFWLYVLGLSCAAVVSQGSRMRGALALVIGLLFSTVGLSAVHSVPRFTFGHDELVTGINFIPAMIGLFGLSEVFRALLSLDSAASRADSLADGRSGQPIPKTDWWTRWVRPVFAGIPGMLWIRRLAVLRSSSIGAIVGMIPGAGADIGAWISYAVSKRLSKKPEEYGQGSLEGIADATTANNAALAGAWIPALVFGIPGDSVTAIVIGVLLMKDFRPGPDVFTDPSRAGLVYSIYLLFLVVNLLLIPLGWLAIRFGSVLIEVPRKILMPLILVFCVVGAFSINGNPFDVWVMLAMGLLGFLLESCSVPLGPVVLGMILGRQLEESFLQNLAKNDSLMAFFERPLSATLGVMCLLLWTGPVIARVFRRPRRSS